MYQASSAALGEGNLIMGLLYFMQEMGADNVHVFIIMRRSPRNEACVVMYAEKWVWSGWVHITAGLKQNENIPLCVLGGIKVQCCLGG